MTPSANVPVEVYLKSSYEPDAEYVDGKIEERPPAQLDHAAWQAAILQRFFQQDEEWNVNVLPTLRIRVDTVQRLKHKLEDYAAMGIPQIWVVDPEDDSFSRYEGKQLVIRGRFNESEREISFEVGEIAKLVRK